MVRKLSKKEQKLKDAARLAFERSIEAARITAARVNEAYGLGKEKGEIEGYRVGYASGCKDTKEQLRDEAENLHERRTELGSAASVIDSMSRVIDAGAQALTSYFADKRNGPHATALARIDEKIAATAQRTDELAPLNFPNDVLSSIFGPEN